MFVFKLLCARGCALTFGSDKFKTMAFSKTFSVSWFVGGTFIHVVTTVLLGLANFLGGMGAFTTGPGASEQFTRKIQWVWTPLAMSAWNATGSSSSGLVLLLALLWSAVIGLAAGFMAPKLRKSVPPHEASVPRNPDLSGTPWENDPHHTKKPH